MTDDRERGHAWPALMDDLRRFVRRRVSDPHVADDIVQDTLTKLAARLGDAPPAGPLHAWVIRVARNAIVDHYRAQRARPASFTEQEHERDAPQRTDRGPLLASFRAFIHELPAEQREAVLLTEYEGISQRDLAHRLGVPVSTIKSRVQRGRKRLAKALADCCSFEFDRRGQVVDWQRRPGGDRRDG